MCIEKKPRISDRGFTQPLPLWGSCSARAGFTLIELLLVLSLAPVVFFAAYSNFSAGVRLWQAVNRETPEEDLGIFYHKARTDLEQMLRFKDIPFEGEETEMSFPGRVNAPDELGGPGSIGQVRYYYNPSARMLYREFKDMSQFFQEKSGTNLPLLKKVTSCQFSYYSKSEISESYSWNSSWDDEEGSLPVAVRLSFTTEDVREPQQRTFFIPVGGIVKK